jgi:hypothetical protein
MAITTSWLLPDRNTSHRVGCGAARCMTRSALPERCLVRVEVGSDRTGSRPQVWPPSTNHRSRGPTGSNMLAPSIAPSASAWASSVRSLRCSGSRWPTWTSPSAPSRTHSSVTNAAASSVTSPWPAPRQTLGMWSRVRHSVHTTWDGSVRTRQTTVRSCYAISRLHELSSTSAGRCLVTCCSRCARTTSAAPRSSTRRRMRSRLGAYRIRGRAWLGVAHSHRVHGARL